MEDSRSYPAFRGTAEIDTIFKERQKAGVGREAELLYYYNKGGYEDGLDFFQFHWILEPLC